ncbi:DUF3298/DUF4163 domain-containing protein [Xylanibacillus composti]|uniref:Anti-SigV factor n=1 Tax=Xylanibacillus composti TaxID=1572762 RepID=A0A8J4H0T5_9BACL|nr:DUF3298 and DUF4163 domain-containing protein [Xylanibacillus composti]MDT9726023.1 DUF3298/DUF4163 domain-containing protein [Xylanibacillus composti]GIQ68833.1 anti-SigV factor [Xylanibacillus composti]
MNTNPLPLPVYPYRLNLPNGNILYPVVASYEYQAAAAKMNDTILQQTYRLLHEQGVPSNPQAESTGYYEVKTNERNVLSLSLFNYTFSGGAHGLTLQKSLTFDAETGRPYTLAELFKPNSGFEEKLTEMVRAQIRERDVPLLTDPPIVRPDADYYIADKALVIYYQVYEIAPYVYQFPYFPISVYSVQDMILEDGPLGRMIY